MKRREIILRDTTGWIIRCMDISDIDHCNSTALLTLEVRTLCDMGDWHGGQNVEMMPWGAKLEDVLAPQDGAASSCFLFSPLV